MEQITNAAWHDLIAVVRLEKACFEKDAWPWLDLLGVLAIPDVVRLKAVSGDEVVGFAAGDMVNAGSLGRILTLGVMPGFRRRGIGWKLLDALEKRLPAPRLQLVLRKSNLAALKLYTRSGYRVVDTWSGYYRDGEDGLVMEKSGRL